MARRAGITALAAVATLLGPVASGAGQAPSGPVEEGLVEQSCRLLAASTVGLPDEVRAEPAAGIPSSWEPAPAGLLPPEVPLRTESETFNRLYEFALRDGSIYGRERGGAAPWRKLPLPPCIAGRVKSISLDDDEMIALDVADRIFTMDNALKDGALFNWSSRWGTPFWTGLGYSLPGGVEAWSWSVISPLEDGSWVDPAGNKTAVGAGKVSHIWGLRHGGLRLTFWDPWLPLDESYEACGPHRGRFRAVNLSASGSELFVIGRHGDLFTRTYDFDISGHDPFFFDYSYEDQRGAGAGAPIQLPAERWVEQPKVPGAITTAISIHKQGRGGVQRILRVEGRRGARTGYWERGIADPPRAGWRFVPTGLQLRAGRLHNPRRDTSARGLGPGEDRRYVVEQDGLTATLRNFNVYCSPASLVVDRAGGEREVLRLHHLDGLRQLARGRGLDGVPREQAGAIEGPPGEFREVSIRATLDEVLIEELGWTLAYAPRR